MTKYILNGGYPSRAADGGRAFCEEIIKGFKEPVKILVCPFAKPKEDWAERIQKTTEFFQRCLSGKNIEIVGANPDKFLEQIRWAHVIYLRGGHTTTLFEALKQYAGWEKMLDGKTLAGESAGANVIAKYHYGLQSLKVFDGFGFLPVKVIVHFRSDFAPVDWDKAYAQLKLYKEDLEMIALCEGEFRVIEK